MDNCQDRPTFFPEAVWKALINLPALRYMKAPVDRVEHLYRDYPTGNEKGAFAFVHDENTFYTYHPRGILRGRWKPISADSVSSFFEIDAEFLKDGDILVYDSYKQKFIIKSGNVWNNLLGELKDSFIQVTKFFNEVEEIPTNESDSGIYYIHNKTLTGLYLVLGGKSIKIFNSLDYLTAKETQGKLDKKANQTQVDDIAASVDILAVTKAEKSVVDALMNGIIKQPAVDTYNDSSDDKKSLASVYGLTAGNNGSNGKAKQPGWDVLVRHDETKEGKSNRYNWNGTMWVDMETGLYDKDTALTGGSKKNLQQIDAELQELSNKTELHAKDNVVKVIQSSPNWDYTIITFQREEDNLCVIKDSRNKLIYYLSTKIWSSKRISVSEGESYTITCCCGENTPAVIGFNTKDIGDRVEGDEILSSIGMSILVENGVPYKNGYLLKNYSFTIPKGVVEIVVQGRKSTHEYFLDGYVLSLKKRVIADPMDESVFTVKAESIGFWNNLLRFIQGTLLTSGIFEERDNRIVSEYYNKKKDNTNIFSASVAEEYEFSVICFDEEFNRLGIAGTAWAQIRKDEKFIEGTVYYRVIIRKKDETAISPSDPYFFFSEELTSPSWDRLVSESRLKKYLESYEKNKKIANSVKIAAPDTYAGIDFDSEYVHNLYDTLLGEYEGIAADDATDNSKRYRVSKKWLSKDQSDLFDIYQYEFKPISYSKTVLFTCLVHGTETMTTLGIYELMKRVVEDSTDSPVLKYMRDNVRVVVIPVVNPWGLNNRQYGNVRGVNPMRNFPYYWNEYISDGSIWDKKGDEPFSEVETKILMDVAISLAGELDFIIDYHTGEGSSWKSEPFVHFDNTDDFIRPALLRAGAKIAKDYYKDFGKNATWEMKEAERALGTYWNWRCLGIPKATIEFSPELYGGIKHDANRLTYLMYDYLCYWTELFSLPKFTSQGSIGIEKLTESEYNALPAKSYKTIYILTDKDNAKKIGDVDF